MADTGNTNNTVPRQQTVVRERQTEDTIDLLELFFRLLHYWKQILLGLLVGALIAAGVTHFLIKPKYSATATIYVLSNSDSVINMSDLQLGTALTNDYIKVFDMWEVKEQVLEKLGLNYTYTALGKMVSVTNTSNTRMLDIEVTSTNPQEAANIANAFAEVAADYISENMATDKPSVMSRALTPTAPSSPSLSKNTVIGAMAGALIVAGIVTVMFLLDDKIRTADDVAKYTGLVNLAIIPTEAASKANKDKKGKGKKK